MKQVILDSCKHYKFRRNGDKIDLLEFPEECPLMKERESFQESEAKVVLSFSKDEEIDFCSRIVSRKIDESWTDYETEFCGDDFFWYLNGS